MLWRDQLKFDPGAAYSTDQLLLYDLRRYLKVIVALQAVFVLTIVVSIGAIWSQLTKYDILKQHQLNAMSASITALTQNAATMSTLAVPIVGNAQFLTSAVVTAVAAGTNYTNVNATASEARSAAGAAATRHLLADLFTETEVPDEGVITSNDLAVEDMQMRRMMRKQVSVLLNSTNTQIAAFNSAAVSDLLEWIVRGVNYTVVQQDFDRVMTDIERTAHFGVLASSMLGLAAAATNTTLPSPSQLMASYSAQKQASSPPSSSACQK